MDYLQNGAELLSPMASLLSLAIAFLIASIAGWYIGTLLLLLRR